MNNFNERINKTKELIANSDYIIIGAGAGLSEAAGFHYGSKHFNQYFDDFEKQYNIHDMYSGTFYNFKTEEEKWAYWARMIKCNTYDTKPTPVYQKLLKLIEHKKYFIITTNADNQFNINGFDMQKYFEVQGNYIYICSVKMVVMIKYTIIISSLILWFIKQKIVKYQLRLFLFVQFVMEKWIFMFTKINILLLQKHGINKIMIITSF